MKKFFMLALLCQLLPLAAYAGGTVIKFEKATGLTRVKSQNGTVLTLKAGQLPQAPEGALGIEVADGRFELSAGKNRLTALAGAEFTLTASSAALDITVAAGAPVQVQAASGHTVLVAPESRIYVETGRASALFRADKGKAMITAPATGETKILASGDSVTLPLAAAGATAPDYTWKEKK